jgi:serine/threonine-protein kinase RsbT
MTAGLAIEYLALLSDEDIVKARQLVRTAAQESGLSLVDRTKLVTAASELARNTVVHGGGGRVRVECLNEGGRRGVRLTFEDQGPGIPDIELALKDGYSTRGGLGLGLSGARRLSNDFSIQSQVGKGTTVSITRWKP